MFSPPSLYPQVGTDAPCIEEIIGTAGGSLQWPKTRVLQDRVPPFSGTTTEGFSHHLEAHLLQMSASLISEFISLLHS